jgi:predicted nucleic acid-binding Zn ribbon protein
MPTYEYECEICGLTFERPQAIKGQSQDQARLNRQGCSLEQTGKTCCGRDERCGKSSCEDI